MADRKTYLYRLDVVYPDGSHDEQGCRNSKWRPADWNPDHPHFQWTDMPDGWNEDLYGNVHGTWEPTDFGFDWPVRRRYISGAGASRQANRLRALGATVTIVRSEPVIFSDQDITPTDLDQARDILARELDCSIDCASEHQRMLEDLIGEVAALRARPIQVAAEGRKVRHLLDLLIAELPAQRAAAFRRALATAGEDSNA